MYIHLSYFLSFEVILKTKSILICFLYIIISAASNSFAQTKDTLTIAFWNVENFFDTLNTNGKNDEEFSPNSKKHWNSDRYKTKVLHLAQVIGDMNNRQGPDILGMAETETKEVVTDLVNSTIKELKYEVVRIQSPDERHISTALIFKSDKFRLQNAVGDTVHLSNNHPTRLILQVSLLTNNNDTINVFVNHWPSRLGGEEASENNRVAAAKTLRSNIDALLKTNPGANIVIMGDFNDEPDNNSIKRDLNAEEFICDSANYSYSLHNLAWEKKRNGEGTLKYNNQWDLLDQIIVSSADIKSEHSSFHYLCGSFVIFKQPYMIETDEKYAGSPLPTYGGNKYLAGYSDHFPVLAKFISLKGTSK
jgi:predicted extracellular nuclease